MNTKHRWYDVIVAWANGEKIQNRAQNINQEWEDFSWGVSEIPSFNCEVLEWRVKPKTIIKRYRMALVSTPKFNSVKNVISVDITNTSIDDPAEYNVLGFIRWVGDIAEVEIEL